MEKMGKWKNEYLTWETSEVNVGKCPFGKLKCGECKLWINKQEDPFEGDCALTVIAKSLIGINVNSTEFLFREQFKK